MTEQPQSREATCVNQTSYACSSYREVILVQGNDSFHGNLFKEMVHFMVHKIYCTIDSIFVVQKFI